MSTKIVRLELSGKLWLNPNMEPKRKKWYSLVFSRVDFWMIWRCHGILYFNFYFLFRNNRKREHWMRKTFAPVMVFFSRKCHSESTWSQLCSNFILNNYETPWLWHLKDTLQLKILWTWINIGVEPAPRHTSPDLLYCMLLFLPNKPSF